MKRVAALKRDDVRRLDRLAIDELRIPGTILMENAGRGVADQLEQLGIEGPVVICCGRGNNGGDGLVVARQLEGRGHAVRVFLWGAPEKLAPDARCNFDILERAGIPLAVRPPTAQWPELIEASEKADWIVDGLLGTGAQGAPRSPMAEDIELLNRAVGRRLAIDLPSGLDADSGEVAGVAFRADCTVTLVAPKPGFAQPGASHYTGEVRVVDIGLPSRVWDLLQ